MTIDHTKHSIGKTTIAKMVKDIMPKNKDKVDTLVAVHTELAEQSGQEVDSVSRLVEEKTKHLKLINDNATKLAKKLTTMIDQIDTPNDALTIANANDKLAITLKVADRHAPKIDITQQMQQVSTAPTAVHYIEDVRTRD